MAKCSECGFLALRNNNTQILDEVQQQYRNKWEKPIGDFNHPLNPVCFVRKFNLWDEIESRGDKSIEGKQGVLTVISKERPCGDSFTDWQQGFTPKEHREMIDRERERKFHFIELIIFIIITLIAGIGGAVIGALIATGKI